MQENYKDLSPITTHIIIGKFKARENETHNQNLQFQIGIKREKLTHTKLNSREPSTILGTQSVEPETHKIAEALDSRTA